MYDLVLQGFNYAMQALNGGRISIGMYEISYANRNASDRLVVYLSSLCYVG